MAILMDILQQSALKFWAKIYKILKDSEIFNHRAKMNSLAAQGKWSKEIESIKKNLFISFLLTK